MARTSRVFDTWTALYELIDAASWPAHQPTGEVPLVVFGDAFPEVAEQVYVLSEPTDQPSQVWGESIPSQMERFTLRVLIQSRVPGSDRPVLVARLKELADVVQSSLRSVETGRMAGGLSATVEGVITWRVARVAPSMWQTPEGPAGEVEIDVAFEARL